MLRLVWTNSTTLYEKDMENDQDNGRMCPQGMEKVHTTINEDMYTNDSVKSQKSNVEKSHDISIIKIDDKNVTKRRKKSYEW